MSTTLTLTRNPVSPVLEIHRGAFEVVVDGQRLGSVEDRETFEAPIDPEGVPRVTSSSTARTRRLC